MKAIFSKVILVSLAVMLTAAVGAASVAMAANGKPFILGKGNVATKITKLVKDGVGPALDLRVDSGPPLKVNSDDQVANLNADQVDGRDSTEFLASDGKAADALSADQADNAANADEVDGKSADEIGVNGLERVSSLSATNSDSPKNATASCPAGKVVVGTGYDITGGKTGIIPNVETDVVIDEVSADSTSVFVSAFEEETTSANWNVEASAICATAP